MLMPDKTFALTYTNAYLVAGILSIVIAWYSKKLLLTIVLGMAIFLVWRAVIG
jgi:branched-subunit amino acid transport protein